MSKVDKFTLENIADGLIAAAEEMFASGRDESEHYYI